MASDREDVTFENSDLRNQWENRSKLFSDKQKDEKERQEKSALNGLFKEWQYRLAVRTGTTASVEKKGKDGDVSDFRKFWMSSDKDEEVDSTLLEAKFKVAPPPKKVKPPPSPPPPKRTRTPPPPPRRERPPPKPEVKKPEPPKWTPVKVQPPTLRPTQCPQQPPAQQQHPQQPPAQTLKENLSLAGWNESWKILKSPLPQQQRGATGERGADTRMYKSMGYMVDTEKGALSEWKESWKHLKNVFHVEPSSEKMSKIEMELERKWKGFMENLPGKSEQEGNWKLINLELQQEVEVWNQEWPEFNRKPCNKLEKAQFLDEAVNLPGWEESWRTPKLESKQDSTNPATAVQLPHVFLPGWNESWKAGGVPVKTNDPSKYDWHDSWSLCQEHKRCKTSGASRYHHYAMMTSKRKLSNEMLSSQLNDEIPFAPQWIASWESIKPQPQFQESHETESIWEKERNISHVPLHLQFHKINTPFSSWAASWKVSPESNASDGEEQPSTEWNDSWKLSNPNKHTGGKSHGDVAFLSMKHKTHRFLGVEHTEDAMLQNEWSESWKTTKPPPQAETQQQQEQQEGSECDFSKCSSQLIDVPLYDWVYESWKHFATPMSSSLFSLTQWTESWKLSNPNHPEQLDPGAGPHIHRHNGPKQHRQLQQIELPEAEWRNSWKYLKSDTLDPNMTREDGEEWGECWRVLNPQLYEKKEAWCEQESTEESTEDFKDLRLQLSFLLKEDRMVLNTELEVSEWNESWRIFKPEK